MSKAKYEFRGDAGWLYADGQILNRCKKTPHEQGILFELELPNGELLQLVFPTMQQGGLQMGEIARESYHEWQAEQTSTQERNSRDKQASRDGDNKAEAPSRNPVAAAIQASQEGTQGLAALEEKLAGDLFAAKQEYGRLSERCDELDREIKTLTAMMEVFNASKILEQASGRISGEVAEGYSVSEALGDDTRSPSSD